MNTNVLTINNLLPLNTVAEPAVQKPTANPKNKSFESSLTQIQSKPENAWQTTTDNNTTQNTQTNPDNQPQPTDTPQTQAQQSASETAQQPVENNKKPNKQNQDPDSTEDQTGVTEETVTPENQTDHILPKGLNIALANVLEIASEKPELPAKAVEVLTQHINTFGEPKEPGPAPHSTAAQKTIIESVTNTPDNQTSQTTSDNQTAANENQTVQNQQIQQTQILDNQLTSAENPETQPAETKIEQPQIEQPPTSAEQQQQTNNQPANILSSYTIENMAVEQKAVQPQTSGTAPEQTEPENNKPDEQDTPSQTTTDTVQNQTSQTSDTNPEQILNTDKDQSSSQNPQTQSQNNQSSKDTSTADTGQLLSESNARLQETEQLQSAEQTAKNNPAETSVPPLGRQIQESMQASLQNGVRQITIQLNPPSLGRVSINFQETEGEITGRLIVSKAETRLEIEQSLPQIIHNLSDSGINIKRVEVVLTNNSDQHSLKEQSFQENPSQQNNFNNQQNGFANNFNQSWTNSSPYEYFYNSSVENPYYPSETYLTETSVNMLV